MGEYDEARRINSDYWIDANEGRWEEAIQASQRRAQLYPNSGIWNAEAEAASAALEAGGIKHLWKAAGRYQVIGVFEFADGDEMDAALHSLPIWQMGHHELVQNEQWIPLRDYVNWAADLKQLSGAA